MKKHLAVMIEKEDVAYNDTLCGRLHSLADDELDNNLTEKISEVTCKCCQAILGNPKHWRYRKYITN